MKEKQQLSCKRVLNAYPPPSTAPAAAAIQGLFALIHTYLPSGNAVLECLDSVQLLVRIAATGLIAGLIFNGQSLKYLL